MDDNTWFSPWLFAAAGLLAAAWSHVRSVGALIRRLLLVSHSLEGEAASILLSSIQRRASPSRTFQWAYRAAPMPDGGRGRWLLRPYRALAKSQGVLWIGRAPIWLSATSASGDDDEDASRTFKTARRTASVVLTFVRGTFDIDAELVRAFRDRNESERRGGPRFAVYRVTGSAGCYYAPERSAAQMDDVDLRYSAIVPVGWSLDEIAPAANPLEGAHLDGDPAIAAAEIARWVGSETWYRERGIPWRRGFALAGPPGTGKTSFVRTVAKLHDLPVTIFDLATMTNAELTEEWHDAVSRAPCIVLFEDFDAVFAGRENVTGAESGLTFDCLLNVIDGVDRAEGVVVVVTTNHLERLDPALLRPGRVDRIVTFGALGQEARRRVAERVLAGRSADVVRVLAEAAGQALTIAEFQERCFRLALDERFGEGAPVGRREERSGGEVRLVDAA